jgi:hypothetical protein
VEIEAGVQRTRPFRLVSRQCGSRLSETIATIMLGARDDFRLEAELA